MNVHGELTHPGHSQSHKRTRTMGRARRNQRDAVRKQRAKKRNRDKQDDDMDDMDDIPNIQYSAKKASSDQQPGTPSKQTTKAPAAIIKDAEETTPPSRQDNHGSTPPSKNDHHKNNTDKSDASGLVPIPKKQTLAKIERMRMKKQQQKARRREKKAAKQMTTTTID
jgi:hypothetical protein